MLALGLNRSGGDERIALGALLNVALLPVEALFWSGFASPGPVVLGVVRVVLLVRAWKYLR